MKILSLGSDRSIINESSETAKRISDYRSLVDEYIVLVPRFKRKVYNFFSLYKNSVKIIQIKKINIITTQDPYYIGLLGYLLANKFKIGLEIQVHGWERGRFRKMIASLVFSRADSIRVVSQRLKAELINIYKINEQKITVVPIYTDVVIKKVQHQDHGGFIFLTASRLVPVKNISIQIEAMAEIVKKYPKTELWVVGDGPERKRLELLTTNYSLLSNVKFLGWQSDLKEYYSKADAFLLTSNQEGWGLVVVEAASYGLSIIMTNVGCAGEFIKDRESGLVIPIGDEAKLIEAMQNLINNKQLLEELGNNVKKSLSGLLTKEETLKLYKESWQKALR
jgi:glycosyltransferase involved in cell wall biosynthesis